MSGFWPAVAERAARTFARVMLLPRRAASRPAPRDAATFLPYDWQALVTRFATNDSVDYATFTRVRRLLEVHLDRVSEARPDLLASDDDRLAFYLNAYNAIAIYQVLLHYPVTSIQAIPAAFSRPFPVGHENMSLSILMHSRIRPFGDPRVHAAIVPAAVSAPRLRAYTTGGLQDELDQQTRDLLADTRRGLRPMPNGNGVILNPVFRTYAGDFTRQGGGISGLVNGRDRSHDLLAAIAAYTPPALRPLMTRPNARVAFMTYDWSLNDTASARG